MFYINHEQRLVTLTKTGEIFTQVCRHEEMSTGHSPLGDPEVLTSVSLVQVVVTCIAQGESVPTVLVRAARETIQAMCQQGSIYGVTQRDVIASLLRQAFARQRAGCSCPSCWARRETSREE